MRIKEIICAFTGAVGAGAAHFLGGWSGDIQTLCTFMVIDFISGLIVAAVFKKSGKTENGALSSKVSFKGLCKKFMVLLFVVVAHFLDMYLGVTFIRSGIIIGFITNELISIIENAGLMGITAPIIEDAIEILRKKADRNED